jgi:hypothetical protein
LVYRRRFCGRSGSWFSYGSNREVLFDGLVNVCRDESDEASQFDPGDLMSNPKPIDGLRANAQAGGELTFVEVFPKLRFWPCVEAKPGEQL